MKKIFKSISLLLALVLVLSVVPTMNTEAASKVKLNKTSVAIKKGKTITLKVNGTKKKVKWSTNNKRVATVTQKGKVTAKKEGNATITAKVSGKKYTCKVTVADESNGVSSYAEACAIAKASGRTPWKVVDKGGKNVWCYVIICHGGKNRKGEAEKHTADYDKAINSMRTILNSRGYKGYYIGKIGERHYIGGRDGWSVAKYGMIK